MVAHLVFGKLPIVAQEVGLACFEKQDLQQKNTRRDGGRSRRWCWKSEWCVGKALCNSPRLDVRACAHAPATFLHNLASLSLSFYLSLSLSLSLVLSEAGMRSTNLSPVHIPTLSITDSSLLPSCLFVSSSCCNDNPVLISPVSASVSPKVSPLRERTRVMAKSAKLLSVELRRKRTALRPRPLDFPFPPNAAENVKRITNPWNFSSSRY